MTASRPEPEITPAEPAAGGVDDLAPAPVDAPGEDVSAVLARATRRVRIRRATRWALAGLNLLLGIAGIVLPVVQAWFHFLVAAALLAPDWPFARRVTLRVLRRVPKLRRRLPRSIRDLSRRDERR